MKIGSVILVLGVLNLLLVLFQLSSGLRFIRVPFAIHRKTGILLFCSALIHGSLALYLG